MRHDEEPILQQIRGRGQALNDGERTKALAMKDADRSIETRPATSNPGTGMKPLPNTDIAPSGALEQEGLRPVVERSRKAR